MLTAVVGINWGDEGKGRMVDLLSAEQDVVVRYQGGNNAGHTVVNERGKFILNLLPSGILREGVVNVMGNGMAIDLEHFANETAKLTDAGIDITPDNLKISDRAIICMPYHKLLDCLEEDRLKDAKFGSTRRGIAPVYSDKYMKKALRMGDLLDGQALHERLQSVLEWKNMTIAGAYGASPVELDKMYDWLMTFGEKARPFVCDSGLYLDGALRQGKRVMLEAQLGALRDIDFGIYPYTSSSNTLAAYGPIGAGIPGAKVDRVVGIMKAYSTCVGEGPFTTEWFGDEAEKLRKAGGEYGAATGRPRRVGPFDAVASRYGVRMQGATELVLTKLDILSKMKELKICTSYRVDGICTEEFPTGEALNRAEPVYITMPGWDADIGGCRDKRDLPRAAVDYIAAVEDLVKAPVTYVSVGPNRDDYLMRS